MDANIVIVVLNWNNKQDTLTCLQSLQPVEGSTIVVDNGSTDGSQEAIRKKFPNCTLIETGINLGYAGGNNVGISHALKQGAEYILILNNDTVVDPQILDAFLAGFRKYPKAGIFGGKVYRMDTPDQLDHFGATWNRKRKEFDFFGHRETEQGQFQESIELDYVCGTAIVIKREVFEELGLFDPRFFLFWEEADFCFRARKAGFAVRTCPEAKVWHKVSASFVGGKPHATYFVQRNRLLWIERNFSGFQRLLLLGSLLSTQLFSLHTKKAIRMMQLLIQKAGNKKGFRNQERIIRYTAALSGVWDYIFRRFGEGRSKNFINCL